MSKWETVDCTLLSTLEKNMGESKHKMNLRGVRKERDTVSHACGGSYKQVQIGSSNFHLLFLTNVKKTEKGCYKQRCWSTYGQE